MLKRSQKFTVGYEYTVTVVEWDVKQILGHRPRPIREDRCRRKGAAEGSAPSSAIRCLRRCGPSASGLERYCSSYPAAAGANTASAAR